MRTELKFIALCLYGIFSVIVLSIGLVGLVGIPEDGYLLGFFLTKMLATVVGVAAFWFWWRITNWLKAHNILDYDD